jgi:hypothetical protein
VIAAGSCSQTAAGKPVRLWNNNSWAPGVLLRLLYSVQYKISSQRWQERVSSDLLYTYVVFRYETDLLKPVNVPYFVEINTVVSLN